MGDWVGFFEWLRRENSVRYSRDLLNYARQYYRCLDGDLSPILRMGEPKRCLALTSLSNLSNLLSP